MSHSLIADIATNIDVVAQRALMLGFTLQMMLGAVVLGWQLCSHEGREAAHAWLAVEEGDPAEGLITMLVIPTLGLLVILLTT